MGIVGMHRWTYQFLLLLIATQLISEFFLSAFEDLGDSNKRSSSLQLIFFSSPKKCKLLFFSWKQDIKTRNIHCSPISPINSKFFLIKFFTKYDHQDRQYYSGGHGHSNVLSSWFRNWSTGSSRLMWISLLQFFETFQIHIVCYYDSINILLMLFFG